MAKAIHVKRAAKDYPQHGIKRGEPYYHWANFRGPKQFSKTPPRPSQLTGSPFLQAVYAAIEAIQDIKEDDIKKDVDFESVASELRQAADDVRSAGEEAQESFDNMPEGLQQGDTGQMLEQRASDAESLADELENKADELDGLVEDKDEGWEDEARSVVEDVKALEYQGE